MDEIPPTTKYNIQEIELSRSSHRSDMLYAVGQRWEAGVAGAVLCATAGHLTLNQKPTYIHKSRISSGHLFVF